MFKKLIEFHKNTYGTILVLFALSSPILIAGFAYMNNYAIWNDLYQFTKGVSKSAAQSVGKQYFSRCIQEGNNLSQCKTAGTASNVTRTIMNDIIQNQTNLNYPSFTYNTDVTILGAVNAQANFIQIPIRVRLSGFNEQMLAPDLFTSAFPTDIDYELQTVINLQFIETP